MSEDKDETIANLSTLVDDLLYEKQQTPAYSDNDFVKWNLERQAMVERINVLQDEVMYWQREAMKQQGRD